MTAATLMASNAAIRTQNRRRSYRGRGGLATTEKKNARAIALGTSRTAAAPGMLSRLCSTIMVMLIGSRTSGRSSIGRICVPVRIIQPAFITDHVQMTAAKIMAPRTTRFVGQR